MNQMTKIREKLNKLYQHDDTHIRLAATTLEYHIARGGLPVEKEHKLLDMTYSQLLKLCAQIGKKSIDNSTNAHTAVLMRIL